jgi:hypothetical protein
MLLRESALAVGALVLAMLILWAIARVHRAATRKLIAIAEQTVARTGIADLDSLRASRLLDVERWLMTAVAVVLHFTVVYATVGYVLRRFPYTRAWGESMRGFLMATLQNLLLGIASAVPGLLTVAIIFCIARFFVKLIGVWFKAVERGQLKPRWLYPRNRAADAAAVDRPGVGVHDRHHLSVPARAVRRTHSRARACSSV